MPPYREENPRIDTFADSPMMRNRLHSAYMEPEKHQGVPRNSRNPLILLEPTARTRHLMITKRNYLE